MPPAPLSLFADAELNPRTRARFRGPDARRPADCTPAPRPEAAPPRDDQLAHAGGGPTLDDLVVGVWEGLSAHRTVPCPACGGEMTPRYGSGPGPVGGRCTACRSTLA
ncbi:MAG: hypothetical protein HZB46_11005 [Solirubrobacterales bacterium]|nr:hypothetical protein [Solirubrobacterales bacterium]